MCIRRVSYIEHEHSVRRFQCKNRQGRQIQAYNLERVNKKLVMNEYNNPSFATMFERALFNTYITTCYGLNPSHHQVLQNTEH
jgi:hypothetical protein